MFILVLGSADLPDRNTVSAFMVHHTTHSGRRALNPTKEGHVKGEICEIERGRKKRDC